jgi:hypothetical protein
MVWDGKDKFRRAVPTGLYIAAAEFGGKRIVRKLQIVR